MTATAEAPTLSRELQREIIRTCLSEHERNLLRMKASGKSEFSIVKLYRQYGDEAGVRRALEAIHAKIEDAAARRLDRTQRVMDAPVEDAASEAAGIEPGASIEQDEMEMPSRAPTREERFEQAARDVESETGASMADAGAPAERTASLSSHGAPAPDADPSPNGSSPPSASPAPAGARAAVRQAAGERESEVVALLGERRQTPKRMAATLGVDDRVLKQVVIRLNDKGIAERTGENARDWPGAPSHGRPSRVWKLVVEPEGVKAPEHVTGSTEPTRRAPVKVSKIAPTGECQHGAPHTLCRVCCPSLPIEGNTPVANAVEHFDARKLWDRMTPEQREELLNVALEDISLADAITSACRGATKRATSAG